MVFGRKKETRSIDELARDHGMILGISRNKEDESLTVKGNSRDVDEALLHLFKNAQRIGAYMMHPKITPSFRTITVDEKEKIIYGFEAIVYRVPPDRYTAA